MQFQKKLQLIKKLLFALPIFIMIGCGVWEDFTTYFNLYYDTSDLFHRAEDKINIQHRGLFSIQEQNLAPDINQLLIKVVEKSSQLLQFHSKSIYVDNALIMLGKSFYYQQNYQKAFREFEELITKQPNSSLVLEAKLWLGKTQMQLKEYTNGLATLNAVREEAKKRDRDKILSDTYVEEIKYRISQNDYAGAVELLKQFLTIANSGEIKAEIVYNSALLYLNLGDTKSAINNFELVTKYSPTFEILYNSQIELGKALRSSGEGDKSLVIYNKMISQDKYADSLAALFYQKAKTLVKLGKMDEALDQFRMLDTAYSRTVYSGLAKYNIAQLYEGYYKNLDSAEVYYNGVTTSAAPIEDILDSRDKMELFKNYREISNNLIEEEKELNYLKNPDAFLKDSIAYYSELEYINNEKNRLSNFVDSTKGNNQGKLNDTSKFNDQKYRDSIKANSGNILDTSQIYNKYQYNRNLLGIKSDSILIQGNKLKENTFFKKKPPVRPTVSADTLQQEIIKYEFQKGNLLFSEFNLPDTAYHYYHDILKNHPQSVYEGRTLYAMGLYYLTVGDSLKADSLFNLVYNDYKNESIVNAAADKLHKPLIDFNSDPLHIQYKLAEKDMDMSKYNSSVEKFYKIFKTNRESQIAAKALYASGWILENKLNLLDSAAAIYDSLVKYYPKSVYAIDVLPKLSLYNQELAKMNLAYRDSVKYYASKGDSSKFKKVSLQQFEDNENLALINKTIEKTLVSESVLSNNKQKTNNSANTKDLLKDNSSVANPDTLIRVFNRGIRQNIKQ